MLPQLGKWQNLFIYFGMAEKQWLAWPVGFLIGRLGVLQFKVWTLLHCLMFPQAQKLYSSLSVFTQVYKWVLSCDSCIYPPPPPTERKRAFTGLQAFLCLETCWFFVQVSQSIVEEEDEESQVNREFSELSEQRYVQLNRKET